MAVGGKNLRTRPPANTGWDAPQWQRMPSETVRRADQNNAFRFETSYEIVLGLPHGEDGARGMAHDAFGRAAKENVL